jgi:hypothetical protein
MRVLGIVLAIGWAEQEDVPPPVIHRYFEQAILPGSERVPDVAEENYLVIVVRRGSKVALADSNTLHWGMGLRVDDLERVGAGRTAGGRERRRDGNQCS